MSKSNIVYVFGDESSEKYAPLIKLIHNARLNPLLLSFLDQVCEGLREEIRQKLWAPQEPRPSFTSLLDITEQAHRGQCAHPAIASALLCTGQLAQVIHYYWNHPAESFKASETFIFGICTGSLAAAALACTQSVLDLIPVAIQIVRVAFRIGFEAKITADDLQSVVETGESWSMIVPAMTEVEAEAMVSMFNEETELPECSKVYLSAIASNSVTISGPPSTLRKFGKLQPAFSEDSGIWLPIHAPYHARHLYGEVNFNALLGLDHSEVAKMWRTHSLHATFISASTGKSLVASNLLQVLETIVFEILHYPLRFDRVVAGCVQRVNTAIPSECLVRPVGVSKAANSLVAALKTSSSFKTSIDDSFCNLRTLNVIGNHSETSAYGSTPPLAIVGMAGRFPGAKDPEELWKVLEQGLDMHREIPSDRFDGAHVDPHGTARNTSHTPYGCFLDDPGYFDARFFNMSPREALQTDPQQRLALSTAYHALEMSGYVPNRTPSTQLDRIGTFFGQTNDDYREINAAQDVDTYFITGGIRAFGPGRINYHFKFSGPSFNVDTACSSGLAAIQLACTSIWQNECDTAVAGGLSVLTSPDLYAGLSRGQFLSKTGMCKTFDDGADGYCRADAVATVVIKRLSDAEADKDIILGVVRGAATNHSADAVSITHPHAETQSRLYRKVLKQASIDPLDVNYIEMHGTGTQAGDSTEMKSVSDVFAPTIQGRDSKNPLFVGAVKANLGHGEAASGVTALVKSLLMLQKNQIPLHIGIKHSINRTFPDLDERKICIALKNTPFYPLPGQRRKILVNNFSAAGGNTALLLEDGPQSTKINSKDIRPVHIVTVSAKTPASLRKNVERLSDYLRANPTVSLPSLSYTTTARRIHHQLRAVAIGTSIDEIEKELILCLDRECARPSPRPRIGFAFTGQGSHYPMLGKRFFDESKVFQRDISRFNKVAQDQGYPSFMPLIEGDAALIGSLLPVQVQLGLVCIEICLARLWASWGVIPDIVVGHSLGEYAALNVAGVLSPSDTVHLVGRRATLLQTRCTSGSHAMLAVRGRAISIEAKLMELGFQTEIACINGPEDLVISGPVDQIDMLHTVLSSSGFKCTKLNVPFAFHSSQVDPILDEFEKVINSVTVNTPKIPIISPLLGHTIQDEHTFSPEYFRRHAREQVNFFGAMSAPQSELQLDKDFSWIEIGAHPVCLRMMEAAFGAHFKGSSTLRRNEDPWKTVTATLGLLHKQGLNIDWNGYHSDFKDALHLLQLPAFAFDETNYWIKYKNNWALTKGDGELQSPIEEVGPTNPNTTSVHRCIRTEVRGTNVSMTFETDFSNPLLNAVAMGHIVNGSGLCPSSILADMAFTVSDYIVKQLGLPSDSMCGNICNMDVSQPLIVQPFSIDTVQQLLHIKVDGDVSDGYLDIEFKSLTSEYQSEKHHAKCIMRFGESSAWLKEWSRSAYLIQARIDALKDAEAKGSVSRLSEGLVYKLFANLVDYSPPFRGMKEVFLDSHNFEATARVALYSGNESGNFFLSPFWIDSLAHLSGFIMNATDAVNSKEFVYISHGWETMRFARKLSPSNTYAVYVKMQPVDTKMVAGDVFILEGGSVVGLIGGLRFQQIPRKLLNMLLPPIMTTASLKPALSVSTPATPKIFKNSKEVTVKTTLRLEVPRSIPRSAEVNSKAFTDKIMRTVADEIGIATSELTSDREFANLGVDSLLTLSIVGRLQSTHGVLLPVTIFNECLTVAELREYLSNQSIRHTELSTAENSAAEDDASSFDTLTSHSSLGSPTRVSFIEAVSEAGGNSPNALRLAIAQETGIAAQDILPSTRLDSMGLDSIMGFSIVAALEAEGFKVCRTAFFESATVDDLEKRMGFSAELKIAPVTRREMKPTPWSSRKPSLLGKRFSTGRAPLSKPTSLLHATSITLEGQPSPFSTQPTVFLFPDGSGSALAYSALPPLDVSLVGLNSPFLKDPAAYTIGIPALVSLYITEIRRIQPFGPYTLGGWSIGGVLAFEAAHQLLAAGEKVSGLILIDAPCPTTTKPMPQALIMHLDRMGVFNRAASVPSAKANKRMLAHFASSVANLGTYAIKPLAPSSRLAVTVIWAMEGVCIAPGSPQLTLSDADAATAAFMMQSRAGLQGGLGWEGLLGGGDVRINVEKVGGNHFSMMLEPWIQQVAEKIRKAVAL